MKRLTEQQRLAVQLYNLTAASMDLRGAVRGVDPAEFRALVHDLRKLRERAFRMLPYVECTDVTWAQYRLAVRSGLKADEGWWIEGQHLDEHTQEDDLRLLLEWLEATS
ncbi:MAG: hypothetical protein HOV66_07855 [Streptomycetaceae bacterium]|nr:hypothetical protein [Streptomycetaceae bacterium]NUS54763.1 hypothetical protein [Streptomycetaceae bacterium]